MEIDDVVTTTQYVRDASGNVLAIYKDTTLIEQPVYGSNRLGQYRPQATLANGSLYLGQRQYELSNHLGNVLAVITDEIKVINNLREPVIVQQQDYYPFGLGMEERKVENEEYRYAFNGKEKDNSFGGSSVYDYGFRIYNPELGKFLSVDPLTKSYPWYTPYQFAGNRPIIAIDVDGLEPYSTNGEPIDQLEKSNLSNVDADRDRNIWDDLNSHSQGKQATSVSGERVDIQGINQAIGRERNVDYYSLDIESLPSGLSKEDFFESFRVYLNHFIGAGTDFKEFSIEDQQVWLSSNPIGAVMQFDGSPISFENDFIEDWISDDLTVIVTDYNVATTHSYWIFSTATTLKNGGHAVSGSRQFGISQNENGGYTFWTRGTDRAHNAFDALISPVVFGSGEQIWTELFKNVNTFINENGGNSSIVKPISKRIRD